MIMIMTATVHDRKNFDDCLSCEWILEQSKFENIPYF